MMSLRIDFTEVQNLWEPVGRSSLPAQFHPIGALRPNFGPPDLNFFAELDHSEERNKYVNDKVRKTSGQNPQNFRTKSAELSLS